MADHAKFSPSKMQRIIACPGSIALESRFPNTTNSYADEGTVMHDLGSQALLKGLSASVLATPWASVLEGKVTWHREDPTGKVKGNIFRIDDTLCEYVQVYVDTIRRRAHGKILLVEQRVGFSEAIGIEDQFGTSDAIIVDMEEGVLEDWDLKGGMGVKVYAENNEQMMTYCVGVIETFGDLLPPIKRIRLGISQPRLDHEDIWECTLEDIQKHAKLMRAAAQVALKGLALYEADQPLGDAFFKAGDKQCRFCKAKAYCPTLTAHVAESVMDDFQALDEPKIDRLAVNGPIRLPGPNSIGKKYGILGLIEDWTKAVRAECERMVFAGMTVVGPDDLPMKLIEGKKGNRAWTDEEKAEGVLTGLLPPEKAYEPRSIITPSAAGKLLDKKRTAASWEMLTPFIRQPPGKAQIALGSDPRPAYSGEAKAEEFADLDDPTT